LDTTKGNAKNVTIFRHFPQRGKSRDEGRTTGRVEVTKKKVGGRTVIAEARDD